MADSATEQMRKEARKLYLKQVRERGAVDVRVAGEDKKVKAPGPYQRTPENEGRANQILYLRKEAAARDAKGGSDD